MKDRAKPVGLAVAVAFVAVSCGNDKSPSALKTAGDESQRIANVWWIMFTLAVFVYLVVAGFVVFGALRGRRRKEPGDRAPRDEAFILFGGVIVPALILLFLAVVTVHTGAALRTVKHGELNVEVRGEQWWWRVQYRNPTFETANEIHLPVNQPVAIGLDSDNVIHSFWVPQLAAKVDTIPGQHNTLRFTPQKIGVYRGLCAEYCGIQHAHMQFLVVVQSATDYGRWVARRGNPAAEPTSDLTIEGRAIFEHQACAGCHTIDGTNADGTIGPNLTDFGSRSTIGAVTLDNTEANLVKWITNPRQVKPGVIMPPAVISQDEVRAVAAYLESLK
jgi:cytochrome c oxidase subunit 2